MTEQVEQATAEDIRRQFWEAVSQAGRIQVHKLNALGGYDTHSFGAEAIDALTATPQQAAKVLLEAMTQDDVYYAITGDMDVNAFADVLRAIASEDGK